MARTNRNPKLENRSNRLKLATGTRYWVSVGSGIGMCYRRTAEGFGTWQARVWTNEQYVYSNLGTADDFLESDGIKTLTYFQAYDKARNWAANALRDAADPNANLRNSLTVRLAAARYLDWYKEHRKGYRETELSINAHIIPELGGKLISHLTAKDIRDWLNKLASTPARKRSKHGKKQAFHQNPQTDDEKRARNASANRTFATLKALLNKAFQDELASDDAAWRRVKPFAKVDEPVIRFLNEAECIRLINACRQDFRSIVRAALFTGARFSELAELRTQDVLIETKMIYIRQSKSGRPRYIPLSQEGLDFFKKATQGNLGIHAVFKKDNGNVWGRNHHVRLLEDACKNANITPAITFHELRHTYASLLAQSGADLLSISKLLGHSDTRITSRHYAHLCDKSLAATVNKLLPSFGDDLPVSSVTAFTSSRQASDIR